MKVNIARAIKSIKGNINFYQPLYEAIVNSFQANATNVEISFETAIEKGQEYIVGYTIKDNGEGYSDKNIDHFLTLWTDHKVKIGALGSGRILCLKVFDNMIIKSQTKDTLTEKGQEVNFDFNRSFEANSVEEVERIKKASNDSYTITTFKNIHEDYLKTYSNQIKPFNPSDVEEQIFINLLPLFINKKENGDEFTIKIGAVEWNKNTLIEKFEELNFQHKYFTLRTKYQDEDKVDEDFDFTLTYRISDDGLGKLEQFYGASDRKVRNFTSSVKLNPLPDKNSGIFCLTSPYFNERVEDSRTDFTVSVTEQILSDEHPISFPSINIELEKLLREILFDVFPTIKTKLEENKKTVASNNPHLSKYIKDISKLGLSITDITNQADEKYRKASQDTKNKIVKFSEKLKKKKKFDYEEYKQVVDDFTEKGQEQLAQYIGYRQVIIDMMFDVWECNNDKDKESYSEDYIHRLIMPPHKIKKNAKHRITENNFWLFDDKFMSYTYTASDTDIEKFLKELEIELDDETKDLYGDDRPDILMLYSDDEDKEKDVVIVELKKINIGTYDKEKAISQLLTYARVIKRAIPNIRDIFLYGVVDLDPKLEDILLDRAFYPRALTRNGHNIPAYYQYNDARKAHVHVLSFKHIVEDASKRNQLFLEILKGEIDLDNQDDISDQDVTSE